MVCVIYSHNIQFCC